MNHCVAILVVEKDGNKTWELLTGADLEKRTESLCESFHRRGALNVTVVRGKGSCPYNPSKPKAGAIS